MPERDVAGAPPGVSVEVNETVARLRAEGFDFDIAETPDAYIVSRKIRDGSRKSAYVMKVTYPPASGTSSCYEADLIEACLRFPDDDSNIALGKLAEWRKERRAPLA